MKYFLLVLLCCLTSFACGSSSQVNEEALLTLEQFLRSEGNAEDDARIRYSSLSKEQLDFYEMIRPDMKPGLFLIDEDPMVLIAGYKIDAKAFREEGGSLYVLVKFIELGVAEGRGDTSVAERRHIKNYSDYQCREIEYKIIKTVGNKYVIVDPPEPRVLLESAISEYQRIFSDAQHGSSDYAEYWDNELKAIMGIKEKMNQDAFKTEDDCL